MAKGSLGQCPETHKSGATPTYRSRTRGPTARVRARGAWGRAWKPKVGRADSSPDQSRGSGRGPVSGHARAASGPSAFPRGEERAPSASSLPVTFRRGAKRLTPFLIEINPRRLSYDTRRSHMPHPKFFQKCPTSRGLLVCI